MTDALGALLDRQELCELMNRYAISIDVHESRPSRLDLPARGFDDHLGAIPVETPGLGFGLGFQVRRDAGIAGIAGSVGDRRATERGGAAPRSR